MNKIYVESPKHQYAVKEENLCFLNGMYAHGKLEHEVGYDLISMDKKKHFDMRRNIDGEECIAVLPDGKEVKALFFHWKAVDVHKETGFYGTFRHIYVLHRGLLVAKNDRWAVKNAREKFNEKRSHI